MKSASNPHTFMGVTEQVLAAVVKATRIKDIHIIPQGGSKGPNYSTRYVKAVGATLEKSRPQYEG